MSIIDERIIKKMVIEQLKRGGDCCIEICRRGNSFVVITVRDSMSGRDVDEMKNEVIKF